MKEYDLIIIGTGSAMNIVEPYSAKHPGARIALIDRDPPGGICLTKGCIPTKMLVYPAEVIRKIDTAKDLGIYLKIEKIDFQYIMNRMRKAVKPWKQKNTLSKSLFSKTPERSSVRMLSAPTHRFSSRKLSP